MNHLPSIYTNPTLRYYCKKMFSSNSNNFDFKTWWAAWIHTMLEKGLKNNTSPEDYSYFPKCLADVLLKMWRHHPHVRQGVNMFVDRTIDLEEFENNIYKSPGKFRKMLNKHCWPVIRCPLGCWQFIDKCRTLQFHHFISKHLDIKIPSAKKN